MAPVAFLACAVALKIWRTSRRFGSLTPDPGGGAKKQNGHQDFRSAHDSSSSATGFSSTG